MKQLMIKLKVGITSIPLVLSLASILVCALTYLFFTKELTSQTATDFLRTNLSDIAMGDTFALSSKLDSMFSSSHIVCVEGKVKDVLFYSRKKNSSCESNFLLSISKITISQNSDVSISFTFTGTNTIKIIGLLFVLLQLLLLFLLIVFTRKSAIEIEQARSLADREITKIAYQVAHDIRSPVAALNMAIKVIPTIPEDIRKVLQLSTKRISDISNDLLEHRKKTEDVFEEKSSSTSIKEKIPMRAVFIGELVDLIRHLIDEKKLKFSNLKEVTISFDTTLDQDLTRKVEINSETFQRIASNLIDNSIEAMNDQGCISIRLEELKNNILIIFEDTGPGFSTEALRKVGKLSYTSGKKNGNGLGLLHAKNSLNSWNAKLILENVLQQNVVKGAKIQILIPITA